MLAACLIVIAVLFLLSSTKARVLSMKMTGPITLYDMPVSNHGARVRLIAKVKNIPISIRKPVEIGGGLKSVEYLRLNPQGKMPLLITEEGYPIAESDTISRYLLDKYCDFGPSMVSATLLQRTLSDQLCRVHDMYITPIQGCMYKATGTPFSTFGTDRKAALNELKQQLAVLENLLSNFAAIHPSLSRGNYLCGDEMCLADATLFPTIIFCMFMLSQFFGLRTEDFLGPRLLKWYEYMLTDPSAKEIHDEITPALVAWKENGRFDPIMEEMTSSI